jgi:hypothetical protein
MMKPEPSERLSRPGPPGLWALARAGLARDEAAEELEHLVVLHAGDLRRGAAPAALGAAHRLGGADVDHRSALLLHQPGEIGKLARLRQHARAERGQPQSGQPSR